MDKTILANNLIIYRKKAKLTQRQIAEIIGMKRSAYAYYELGKTSPKIDVLNKIAKIYNVSVEQLASEEAFELTAEEKIYMENNQVDDSFNELSDLEKAVVLRLRIIPSTKKREVIDMLFER